MNIQKESYLMIFHRQTKMSEVVQNQDIYGYTNDTTAPRRLGTGLNQWFSFLGKLRNMRIRVTFDPPEPDESILVNDVLIL